MLIALLVTLGVDLVFVAAVLSSMRWVSHQPRAIRGEMPVAGGEVDGLGAKWRPGYGRRVRDVLVPPWRRSWSATNWLPSTH
jgi:hypothetical protein